MQRDEGADLQSSHVLRLTPAMELLRDPGPAVDVEEAYARCIRLARHHYENFTVGSRFLPRELRRHMCAVYAYCRFVDDLGDEAPAGEQLRLLELWQADLDRCYGGAPQHPYLVALQATIQTFDIPPEPFHKLVEANRMDQDRRRYATYGELLEYCNHSANPVGRLVLYLFGHRDPERQALADDTCTALQLANFWQDVRRDLALGRVYIPLEDMARFGYAEEELAAGVVDERFRALMAFEVERARELFHRGARLVELLRGTAKLDMRLFTRGGLSVLQAIEHRRYDVLNGRPVVTSSRKLWLLLTSYLGLRLAGRL